MTISARVICDSISEAGVRFTTFEVEFHRYILSEYNTHRVFSRNAASTRAIPILRMLEQISNNPAMPVYYGKNQPGMSAKEELPVEDVAKCKAIIEEMRDFCVAKVGELHTIGLHKQHAGRYIEAWQTVKGVVSSTEWDNFFWLRDDEAAQPEIQELARTMKKAYDESVPELLQAGEWHLPYVVVSRHEGLWCQEYWLDYDDGTILTLEEAIKVSCARCAAVSFRNVDYDLQKSVEVYDRLLNSGKIHGSAFEHCATPMLETTYVTKLDCTGVRVKDYMNSVNSKFEPMTWQEGISHCDRDGNLWSGNLRGYIQHRKCIKGENYVK